MEKFYLGMDIGTNSVGMACTDEEYHLLRAKGQDCWTVRLFEAGQTAANRRTFRTMRRRLARRRQRIMWLQGLFAPFVKDHLFFIRLNNSQYYPEDKASVLAKETNLLFADNNFKDKDYHKKYPTIYHLREALMTGNITDSRLYYLALHHIIKYRGHFLFEGSIQGIRDSRRLFEELNEQIGRIEDNEMPMFDAELSEKAKEILLKADISIKEKQKELQKLWEIYDGAGVEIIKGICGATFSPKKLFVGKYEEEKGISFKGMTDESFDAMQSTYGDDFLLLNSIRGIFSFVTFERLLIGHKNISSAMIAVYDKHKEDLRLLKNYFKENTTREQYNTFFKGRKDDACNYVNYIGYTKQGGEKKKVKICKDEDFRKNLKKILSAMPTKCSVVRDNIIKEIDDGNFLPKILHSDNGLFPHQVNEYELDKILENMVRNIPETAEIASKIKSIFLYRIPYYVGPLTGKNSWVVKNEGKKEKITPWNFNEVIDLAKSNEEFMRRMTNKCSYLRGEDVLPKESLIYQQYNVLNQINKLRVDERPISVSLKQKIFCELFKKKDRVKDRDIISFLVREGFIPEESRKTAKLQGKDEGDLNASLSSYHQLKRVLGDFVDKDIAENGGDVCEKIILWHTLNTDKKIVRELVRKNYGDIIEIKKNIDKISKLSFREFGRLSQKLLTGIISEDEEGRHSILDVLFETNMNLNEILFSERYEFMKLVKQENGEESSEITYQDLEDMYVSPAVRRGIWQSLKMADEYVAAIGKQLDRIFVEVTREDGEKGDAGRKYSRKKQLLTLYSAVEDEALKKELNDTTESDLRSKRLYLYFRQLGRCMYSGERISLSELSTTTYDVDHILPRTYIKDDSLDNKVLVLRSKNADKKDIYPLPNNLVTAEVRQHWEVLRRKKLISDTTYNRLIRVEPLNEDDYNSFINRQKVITDQTAKAVAELLKRKYPNSTIVYSKAKNVNDFRNKFDLFKCRETNDLHHARDAYLNIVVGNVYHTLFSTPMAMFYQKEDGWRTVNLKNMFEQDVKGAWNEKSLETVKQTYSKTSMAVTKYAFCNKGKLYNETVYPHTDEKITAPRKEVIRYNGNEKERSPLLDISKYGGYKTQSTAYFAIVRSKNKKDEVIKTIEAVPVMISNKSVYDTGVVIDYFRGYLKEPEILVKKIKVQQLVKVNGVPLYITGITGNQVSFNMGVQFFTGNKIDEYVKGLSKLLLLGKEIDKSKEVYIMKTNRLGEVQLSIDREKNIKLYQFFIDKINNGKESIYSKLPAGKVILDHLTKDYVAFLKLSVYDQTVVLMQVLNFFKSNAGQSDFSLMENGKGTNCGKIIFAQNITGIDFRIVHQSCCGLIVREQKV